MQLLRVFFGFLLSFFIVEQVFLGPSDSTLLLANLNLWGLTVTLFSMLFQYKSSNYEVAKSKEDLLGVDVSIYYPYSTWYKLMALRTLEASLAINFVSLLTFYIFIIPNQG